ncbi:unnamed protein product [Euphydryas editha]|uniref:Uncharacterized protein n=1 Tax=Euphydryas editha TaxID=104508 RepID=A0AAU9UM84_EUPED|nr:unnamed protein product [Euphydryas editha]
MGCNTSSEAKSTKEEKDAQENQANTNTALLQSCRYQLNSRARDSRHSRHLFGIRTLTKFSLHPISLCL